MIRRSIFVLLVVLAVPLSAQRVVSRIEVRGNVPASIVIPQSALVEGRSYTDADLEVAVARIRRLPFVYEARYSFEDGALVLDVTGMTPFFFELDAIGTKSQFADGGIAIFSGGGRLFAGDGGVVQATVGKLTGDASSRVFGLEYANYGIAGTRLFAIASGELTTTDDGFEPDPTYSLTVGYPLTVRQTLSATAIRSGFEAHREFEFFTTDSESEQTAFQLRWAYDTSDDPFFALRGTTATVSASRTWVESHNESIIIQVPSGNVVRTSSDSDGHITSLGADAIRFWPLGRRGAVTTRLETILDDEDITVIRNGEFAEPRDANIRGARVAVGYAHNFFDSIATHAKSRHRAEFALGASRRELD
ncbi:MAG TPA: hypothetical protein VHK90_05715, partial [Thermoanaerobaculia bacterium]|nr:hypothetical protein [Thermoanaerobaculia bacterium]